MNKKKYLKTLFISIIILIVAISVFSKGNKDLARTSNTEAIQDSVNMENFELDSGLNKSGEALLNLEEALTLAITDEYKARATYNQIIDDFGEVKPFVNIKNAEEQHINSLVSLFKKYNYEVPSDIFDGNIKISGTLAELCAVGVQAEIDNAALYQELLIPSVLEYEDVTRVFKNLMSASENNHLSAFEGCSS